MILCVFQLSVDIVIQPGIQIRIANSQNCEKLRMRSEFASLRFAEKDQSFASLSLRILDTQIRRIAKKFAESSQKVILNFLKKDEFLTIFASLSSHFFVLKRQIINLQNQFRLSLFHLILGTRDFKRFIRESIFFSSNYLTRYSNTKLWSY